MMVRFRMASGDQFDAEDWRPEPAAPWQPIELGHVYAAVNDPEIHSIIVLDDLTKAWRILRAEDIESIAEPGDRAAIRDRELNAEIERMRTEQFPLIAATQGAPA